jgi:hypothetical protein
MAPAQVGAQLAARVATGGHEWVSDVTARMSREAARRLEHETPNAQLAGSGPRPNGHPAMPDAAGPTRVGASPAPSGEAREAADPGTQVREDADPRTKVLVEARGGERRVALAPDEVGPNGERRPGMADRWQAPDEDWTLHLGGEDGWPPTAWQASDPPQPDRDPADEAP